MTATAIPTGTANWDVPVNAALLDLQGQATSLQGQVTANGSSVASLNSRATALESANVWGAPDHGLVAWAYDPSAAQAGSILSAGVIYLVKVNVRAAASVINVICNIATTPGSGLVGGQNFIGLYRSDGTLVAAAGDQSVNWTTTGTKITALSGAPYALSVGAYYIALLANGTTPPTVLRGNSVSASVINVGLATSAGRYLTVGTGQTALPASIALGTATASGLALWGALS